MLIQLDLIHKHLMKSAENKALDIVKKNVLTILNLIPVYFQTGISRATIAQWGLIFSFYPLLKLDW